jgi:hypothetical protein
MACLAFRGVSTLIGGIAGRWWSGDLIEGLERGGEPLALLAWSGRGAWSGLRGRSREESEEVGLLRGDTGQSISSELATPDACLAAQLNSLHSLSALEPLRDTRARTMLLLVPLGRGLPSTVCGSPAVDCARTTYLPRSLMISTPRPLLSS